MRTNTKYPYFKLLQVGQVELQVPFPLHIWRQVMFAKLRSHVSPAWVPSAEIANKQAINKTR